MRGQTVAALRAERDHADSRAQRALLEAIYPENHPYRSPLSGTEALVERLERSSLLDFHSHVFLAVRPTIIVAGDVDPDEVARELEARLMPWTGSCGQGPTRPLASVRGEPGSSCSIGQVLRRPLCGLATSGSSVSSPDHDHMLVVNQILGGQFTSRLNESLREARGLTYGVRSSFDWRRKPGPFTISTSVQTEKVGEALEQIRIELEDLCGRAAAGGKGARRSPPVADRGTSPAL